MSAGVVCPRAPVTGAGSGRDCRTASTTGNRRSKARRFALDSLVEGNGFEPLVPCVMDGDLGRQVPALIAVFELTGTAVALQCHTEVVRPDRHLEFP
jgi:hypothetical protein